MPINDVNRVETCNKFFLSPNTSPFTGKPIGERTQKKFVRACSWPLTNIRAFLVGDGKLLESMKTRIPEAGGAVVSDESEATHIIHRGRFTDERDSSRVYVSLNTFVKMYYRQLYNECERFKADETHSPKTYRRIKPDGPTHKRWSSECADAQAAPRIVAEQIKQDVEERSNTANNNANTAPKKLRKPRKVAPILDRIKAMCLNDIDPVTLEQLTKLPEDDLKRIIKIGESKHKAHCMKAESAMRIYESAALEGREPRNPFNGQQVFTNNEIAKILRAMKRKPVSQRNNANMTLRLEPETFRKIALWRISVAANDESVISLGYAPSEIDAKLTGSEGLTSATLSQKLVDMFEKQEIATMRDGVLTVVAPEALLKSKKWWFENGNSKKAIAEKFKMFLTL